jgi:8-oxo-dGTP pyrophosphatase MutT (NUDIX family)
VSGSSPDLAANELVQIVDSDNRLIGTVPRREMRARGHAYRATYILVFNRRDELFLQQRTESKDMYPGYYDAAAGGVLVVDEDYDRSARRELEEELGITAVLTPQFDFYFEDQSNRIFGRAYVCRHDGPFRLQAEEVADGFFCDPAEILRGAYQPLTPDSRLALERYCSGRSSTS